MKKSLKVILIVLIVISVAVGAVAIWQRKNIEGVIIGIKESTEEIEKKRDDNHAKLAEDVDSFLQKPLRKPTEEEKKQVEEGKMPLSDVYAKIYEEENSQIKKEQPPAQTQSESQTSSETQKPEQKLNETENKPTKDEIITQYMSELYRLQSEFTARAESTIKQGDRYYEELKKESQDKVGSRAKTISYFTPIVRSIEAESDAKVEKVIQNLINELSAIGENTDIARTIRAAYEKEKQLKLAYYSNKYLK